MYTPIESVTERDGERKGRRRDEKREENGGSVYGLAAYNINIEARTILFIDKSQGMDVSFHFLHSLLKLVSLPLQAQSATISLKLKFTIEKKEKQTRWGDEAKRKKTKKTTRRKKNDGIACLRWKQEEEEERSKEGRRLLDDDYTLHMRTRLPSSTTTLSLSLLFTLFSSFSIGVEQQRKCDRGTHTDKWMTSTSLSLFTDEDR